jgi:hypothetical protein
LDAFAIEIDNEPQPAHRLSDIAFRDHREVGGPLALDCEVLRPGRIRVGDGVSPRKPT